MVTVPDVASKLAAAARGVIGGERGCAADIEVDRQCTTGHTAVRERVDQVGGPVFVDAAG